MACIPTTTAKRKWPAPSPRKSPTRTVDPMPRSALNLPQSDPKPIFDLARNAYGTELLTAAIAHFDVFGRLTKAPLALPEFAAALGFLERGAIVLTTALRAMGLLAKDHAGRFTLTPLAVEHLVPGSDFYVGEYLAMGADSPAVRETAQRWRSDRPGGGEAGESGVQYIYRAGVRSAMEQAEMARYLTLGLAGRRGNVAPALARAVDLSSAKTLLDVGGGSGLYCIAFLQRYPQLRGIVLDRPEVLQVAAELAAEYGVSDRLTCHAADMLGDDPWPAADAVLLSNVLHDWHVPECRKLVARSAAAVPTGGQVLIHDAFLNDGLDGPLAVAQFSIRLYCLTEGRCYSAAEYRGWLEAAGLRAEPVRPTLADCGVLAVRKA